MAEVPTEIEAPPDTHATVSPVPVILSGETVSIERASEFGSGATFAFGAADAPRMIAGQDSKRRRLLVLVTTGQAWLGTEEQCKQVLGGNLQGGGLLVTSGSGVIELRSQARLFAGPGAIPGGAAAAAVNVSVWTERDGPTAE